MAHLAQLWAAERERHVEAFYQASRDAEAASKQEWEAAVTIQRCWKGYAARKRLNHARVCVRAIQRVYSDWKRRKTEREAKVRELQARRDAAYHGGATKLQALWRGYRSRTDVFDFRSRARYLVEREQDKMSMTQKLQDYREEVKASLAEAERRRNEEAYLERARRQHHMLSTSAQTGVYSTALGGRKQPEVREDDIRAARPPLPPPSKRISLEKTKRASMRVTHWVLPKTPADRKRLQGPFRSPEEVWALRNRPRHPTLRAETPYTAREAAEAEDKQREWRTRVVDAPFLPTSKNPRGTTTAEEFRSIRTAERYVDPPIAGPNAPATRQISFRKIERLPRSKDFVTTARGADLFDDY